MSSLRSSVKLESSKQPWGTITKPEFGMGYQKMTDYEVDQTVNRLYTVPTVKERIYERPGRTLPEEEVDEIVSSACSRHYNLNLYTLFIG